MANICNYEVRVKGSYNACLMVYASMPCADDKEIRIDEDEGFNHLMSFVGDCKWSVNFDVVDDMDEVDIDSLSRVEIMNLGSDYWSYSLRAKSEVFGCEIMVHYWSGESGFDQFDHYDNGECIKQRKIEYDYDNDGTEFDWDILEFVGHEDEYDDSVDGEEADVDFMNRLNAIFGCAPVKTSLSKSEKYVKTPIGKTGYDLFDWTFTEGKTAKGDGWTIVIPDGFVKVKSPDGRVFELVPKGYEKKDLDEAPIRVLPGSPMASLIKENWMYHANARAGIASIIGSKMSELMGQQFGIFSPVFSTAWDDVCAFFLVNDTSNNSYSFQGYIINDKISYAIRIQTQSITNAQKQMLKKSIIALVNTVKIDERNKKCPTEPLIDKKACLNEALKGKLNKLNEAIDQATMEYRATLNGYYTLLEAMEQHGCLSECTKEDVSAMLTEGLEVREFYLERINNVVHAMIDNNVDSKTMKKVFSKLEDFNDELLEFNVGSNVVRINQSEKVSSILNEWKALKSGKTISSKTEKKPKASKVETEVNAETKADVEVIEEHSSITGFEVTDDIPQLIKFIKNFNSNSKKELEKIDEEIIGDRKITRKNDSRIRKYEDRVNSSLSDFVAKLMLVTIKLDELGTEKLKKSTEEDLLKIADVLEKASSKMNLEKTYYVGKNMMRLYCSSTPEYDAISDKWKDIKGMLPTNRITTLQSENKKNSKNILNLETEKKSTASQLSGATRSFNKLDEDYNSLLLYEEITLKKTNERKAELDSINEKIKSDIDIKETSINTLNSELDQLNQSLTKDKINENKKIESLSTDVDNLEKKFNNAQNSLSATKQQRDVAQKNAKTVFFGFKSAKENYLASEKKLDELEIKVIEYELEFSKRKIELDKLRLQKNETDMISYQKEVEIKDKIASLNKELKKLNDELTANEKKRAEEEKTLNSINKKLNKAKLDRDAALEKQKNIVERKEKIIEQINDINLSIKANEEEIQSLKQSGKVERDWTSILSD